MQIPMPLSLQCITPSRQFVVAVAAPHKFHSNTFTEKGIGPLNKCKWGAFFSEHFSLKP